MKKLLSLLLCIVFVCIALVGCAEDVIGEYLPNYNTGNVTDDQIEKLNFYIITGDNTSPEAKITVPQNINSYIKEKYLIELNIKYYTETEYADALYAALDNSTEAERPDIILLNSKDMFDNLYSQDTLVALNSYYESRDFRSINTIVDDVLLEASAVIDTDTNASTYYTVPNNHVIDEYRYIVIDKGMAMHTLHFNKAEISAMTTAASLEELKAAIANYYVEYVNNAATDSETAAYIDQYVQIVAGDYDARTDLANDANGANFVNINSYPNATKDEAFLSAFAIVKHLDDVGTKTETERAILDNHYSKCMQIIYALNTDAQLKNMLQYGYVGTNYKFIKNEKNENTNYIELIKNAEVIYEMNNAHTGNMFISYYCSENGWDETVHNNYLRQNADAKTPEQKLSAESADLELFAQDEAKFGDTTALSLVGATYGDVSITWNSDSEHVSIVGDTLTLILPAEAVESATVTVVATLTCGDSEVTKTFDIAVTAPEA